MTAHGELISAVLAKLITDSAFRTSMNAAPQDITGATGTQTIIVTCAAHGYSIGDFAEIDDVEGMTVLNTTHKITAVTTNTFTVVLASTTEQEYTTGGTVRRLANFYYEAPQGIPFPYNVFSIYADNYTFSSSTDTEEIYIQFSLYDKRDVTYISTLESGLIDLFDGASLTFSNYTQISLTRKSKRYSRDEDKIYQTIIEYRIVMQHN